ncbi:MAG: Crp/Fnr family transcriptional regulator [Candidatus Bipolaricaulota bacterium]|nr:Crp/Fnr family transcriptional regulator [Candidatus Bipolaricaulota bacterium]
MVDLKATETDCCSFGCRSSCVLSAVEPEVLAGLAPRIQRVRFGRGETILHEGTPTTGWAILCQGGARLTASAEQGKRVLLRFCSPGELVSGSPLVAHVLSATAVVPSVAGFIGRETVDELVRRCPEALLAAHRQLTQEQGCLVRRLVDLTYASTRQRLVRALLELGDEHGAAEGGGVRIDLPLSLRDLAEMIGAARPTTSGELQALARRGLVRLAWPTVFLLDPDGLRRHS